MTASSNSLDQQELPYLRCLKGAITGLSAAVVDAPDAARQGFFTGRLIDYMVVQREALPGLRVDFYHVLLPLLAEVESHGWGEPSTIDPN